MRKAKAKPKKRSKADKDDMPVKKTSVRKAAKKAMKKAKKGLKKSLERAKGEMRNKKVEIELNKRKKA